jgi:hypothetical protein
LAASSSSSPLFYNDFEDYENNNDDGDDDEKKVKKDNSKDLRGDMKDDGDIDDEDEYLNVDELGDWKELRRKLVTTTAGVSGASDGGGSQAKDESVIQKQGKVDGKNSKASSSKSKSSTACKENAAMIETQCEDLAEEYRSGVWAHPTPTVRSSCRWSAPVGWMERWRMRGFVVAYMYSANTCAAYLAPA